MVNYLIRLDDACPGMDSTKWSRMESILDKYNIKPLVGIIPNNLDKSIVFENIDESFWGKARNWQEKKWSIAMHGYNHLCLSNCGGINPFYNRSEFAGLPLSQQEDKISMGFDILSKAGLEPNFFFAPSHTFDENTIVALINKTRIRYISDTIAFNPYKFNNFVFFPQQFGNLKNIKISGYWTFCLHPNNISNSDFVKIENFIHTNLHKFISFDQISVDNISVPNLFDSVFKKSFFFYRNLFRS